LLLSSVAAGVALAAPVDPAAEYVRQLASPKYQEREKAAAELLRLGRAAKPALVAGTSHSDPEVRNRCQQLLPRAMALDLQHRVDRFLADTSGQLSHDLPMLKRFREQVGSDEPARQLYTDMLKANAGLLEAVEQEPARVTERVQRWYVELYHQMFGGTHGGFGSYRPGAVSAADLCCVLLVAATPAYKPTEPDWMLSELYAQAAFTTALKDTKKGVAHRRLFLHYLDARMDDNTVHQCVWMLTQHRIRDGADVLAKALRDGKAKQIYTKATALCCIGTLGSREHLTAIEPFLKDDTQVQPFFVGRGQRGAVQLRDVALAMTLHLAGRNPKDFGFVQWNVYPNQIIQYHQLGFGSDEERTKAFAKWADESRRK
jgi:hypothetical protein